MSKEDSTESSTRIWHYLVVIGLGIFIGATTFSTHTTDTVYETKWKDPGDQITKYTIHKIDASLVHYDDEGNVRNLTQYNSFQYMDYTERFKGDSVLVKNGIQGDLYYDDSGKRLTIESVDYKTETYQNGNMIDSYETSCGVYIDVEDRYDSKDAKQEIYSECFDLKVEN